MRILFLGDVLGRSGRTVVQSEVPRLRKKLGLDFVFVNGENAAQGFGITEPIVRDFLACGVDCITTGNHIWNRQEILPYMNRFPQLLRPLNYPEGAPGIGVGIYDAGGRKVAVVNLMGRIFTDPLDCPFAAMEKVFLMHGLRRNVDAILVDFHAEATSEKVAFGHFCDGRVSLVVGTHTHIPTADHQVLPGGTAYITDAGMCGDYDSVIGMQKESILKRFRTRLPGERMRPAEGAATLCGVFIETNDATGLAVRIAPVRVGGRLSQTEPD
ncbi:MAG TPA: TIGR00282 family metallophosphoesterase [Rhodospirillaceae bacterium]|nr:MAG: metallophosphoesterase [Alphaproteobacteria bacterium GWF2_58_20]HAU29063.1 TIGR00282 family metallophosphoesterase [Rhodospirillaceae bacterium]